MNTLRERILYLHYAVEVDASLVGRMYTSDPTLKTPFSMTPQSLASSFTIRYERAKRIHDRLIKLRKLDISTELNRRGIGWMCRFDSNYPVRLTFIYDPPSVLFYQGDADLLSQPSPLAVIGSRKPSIEAKHLIEHLLHPLHSNSTLVVSGLAEGIDALAHKWALRHHVPTVAVLGSGFNHVYPSSNTTLAKSIIQKNLLLSEYPPDCRPQKWHFPQRNRIIAGLSNAVLIVEATEKSGSMITVNFALEQGKEVLAVPGSPLKMQARGCLRLIQEGAKVVVSSIDIMEEI
ncbi:DNA-processing protein DprA [Alteribacter aurantiacus]|uniref:DNA-processing protein DprA n=1 Tax=Alteribacter aurantiacus TaxID=254410 RepID=UPI000400B075|nr:DNA-processing protein DprA [Alteribacter aurantiacus]